MQSLGVLCKRGLLYAVTLSTFLLVIGRASGGVLDLRDLPGNINQEEWGQPGTTLYAQTLTADDEVLSRVIMRATAIFGDIHFNVLVTGARFDFGAAEPDFNDIRYSSGMRTIPVGAGLTEVSVSPNVAVKNGENVCVVFDTFSYTDSGWGSMRATSFTAAVDPYPLGEFLYLNTNVLDAPDLLSLNASPWTHRGSMRQDLAIYAQFIPEPATSLLVVVAGFLKLSKRKRYFSPLRAN